MILSVLRTPWRVHRRVHIALRALLAVAGSYGVASLIAAVLAQRLPMRPVDASMTAVLVAIVLQPLLAMWAIGAAHLWRAAWPLLLAALLAALCLR
jgi:hypothetical protein